MTISMDSRNVLNLICKAWTQDSDVDTEMVLGKEYFKIILPNYSIDGTRYELYLRREGDSLIIRDFGLNLMNLEANNINLDSETIRRKIITVSDIYAKDSSYTSREFISTTAFDSAGQALLNFVNLLTIVGSFALDADFKAKFTFEDEVAMILRSTYGSDSIIRDWSDPQNDPHGAYKTDYLILREDKVPAATFAISGSNSAKVAKAALTFTHFSKDSDILKVMVFKDFSKLPQADRARAKDHADVIIENIVGTESALDKYNFLDLVPK
jgi:Domain of unknown function DUF1828